MQAVFVTQRCTQDLYNMVDQRQAGGGLNAVANVFFAHILPTSMRVKRYLWGTNYEKLRRNEAANNGGDDGLSFPISYSAGGQ